MRLCFIAEKTVAPTVSVRSGTAGGSSMGFDVDDSPRSSFRDAAAELNPNELLSKGRYPQSFIFTDRLHLDRNKSGRAHATYFLSGDDPGLVRELSPFLTVSPGRDLQRWRRQWRQLYSRFLFGRVAWMGGRRVVSFWGSGSGDGFGDITGPMRLAGPCLRQLYSDNVVDDDTTAVLPDGSVGPVGDLLGGRHSRPDAAAAEKLELARRLHLATGSEKRELLARLGVGGGGSDRVDPWDHALQQLPKSRGGLAPGQSKWRMSSESGQRHLESALSRLRSPLV